MIKRVSAAGVGALAFAVLTLVGVIIDDSPGGTYKASDVAKYLRHGHRPVIFVAMYLVFFGVVGLVLLLARLRDAMLEGSRRTVFWGLSIAGIGAWVAGYAIHMGVPVAMAYGGSGVSVTPTTTYVLNEAGYLVLTAGAILIGLALLTFVLGPVAVPAWTRWFTLVGAVGALASPTFFFFALFFIWAIVMGLWLLVSERERVAVGQTLSA
jgi:hypothetical protein